MTTKELMAYAKSKGRVKTRYIDTKTVGAKTMEWLASRPKQSGRPRENFGALTVYPVNVEDLFKPVMQTKVGDRVRPCFNATLSGTTLAPPLVPARLGNVFVVDAMAGGAVRIGGNCWRKSWVRVTP